MGAMFVMGHCYTCGRLIMFNPTWVPSLPRNLTTTGDKEPVCESCVARANPDRIKNGLPPIEIHPLAYEPEEC